MLTTPNPKTNIIDINTPVEFVLLMKQGNIPFKDIPFSIFLAHCELTLTN